MEISKENIKNLPKLNSEIHDKWFSVDKVIYDPLKKEFCLSYGTTQDVFNKCLQVTGVLDYQIIDTEKITNYDINYLTINLEECTLSIIGCIPVRINLNITSDFKITTSPR